MSCNYGRFEHFKICDNRLKFLPNSNELSKDRPDFIQFVIVHLKVLSLRIKIIVEFHLEVDLKFVPLLIEIFEATQ